MSTYTGMRWFKCDLHVHTPVDGDNDPQEKARQFLNRCHDVGLHVIGVTDHNFSVKRDPKDWFLTRLVEQNRQVANARGVAPLTIFPGFEVDIDYHVLCLFKPVAKSAALAGINDTLIKLGLDESQRFASGRYAPLRYNDAKVPLKRLLEIVQKKHGGLVIAAHADRKDGMLSDAAHKEDYALQDLYCVELTQKPPVHRYKDILDGNNPDWRRERFHPAWIMSSDAKFLVMDPDGNPVANSLGYRHTWIKMSKPSIESLRQAFLDPISRIRPGGENPADQERHARIVSLSVSGAAFLGDQEVAFSPNLNCIIGGRGSGKSALLEGMRLAMGKDKDPKLDSKTNEKLERIRKLLKQNPGSKVRVHWCDADGVEDQLEYVVSLAGSESCRVEGRDMQDPEAFLRALPVQFFSQQQLNQVTEQNGAGLLALLDDFARADLHPLWQRERELRREIGQLFATMSILEQAEKDFFRLQQESVELERQWEARAALRDEAIRHQGLQAEQAYVRKLYQVLNDDRARFQSIAEDVCATHPTLGSDIQRWPHGAWFKQKDDEVLQAKETLKAAIVQAAETYHQAVVDSFKNDPEWPAIKSRIDNADAMFTQVCAAKGVAPGDVSRIQEIGQKRQVKKQEVEQKKKERDRLQQDLKRLPDAFQSLHDTWREMHWVRDRLAQEIASKAQWIGLKVEQGKDADSFRSAWSKFSINGRTRLGRAWPEIGELVHQEFMSSAQGGHASPWAMVQEWVDRNGTLPTAVSEKLGELRIPFEEIRSFLTGPARQMWQDVRVTRVEDAVDLVLYRDGFVEVGRISDGTLSDGQRNTALLAMLMARGDHPLIIDQPEDELDSNFIYRELVPMLRRLKQTRQIILVTHNANLPVNGDAELVFALEAREGHGVRIASGGLDQEDVTRAVLDIMEGSEKAFHQRKEKYHF